MKWIFLFRHGETDFNREHRFQGHLDIPLNDEGRRQAALLMGPLKRLGCQEILSSDLCRAVETAQIASAPLGITIFKTAGLREAFLGYAQGLTTAEIEARFGQALAARWRSPYATDADVSYPGGETGKQVLERVLSALKSHLAATEASRIGIATHGGVIRRVVRSLMSEHEAPIPIPNGILYAIQWNTREGRFEFPAYTPLDLSQSLK
jgi:broad specificity phosphatase PhoE